MNQQPPSASILGSKTLRASMAAFIFLLACTLLFQYRNNAYMAEFGDTPDEAGHYVTGLFFLDYLTSGDWFQPLEFAKNYYVHYPRVSIGNWPPFFYFMQSVWMLVAGPSRLSLMLLMALISTSIAWIIYRLSRDDIGHAPAACLGLIFLAYPTVNYQTARVLADNPTTLNAFLAAFAFLFYMRRPSMWRGLLWGVAASAAILTKGNAGALALVFPATIMFTRRWKLFLSAHLWIPALLVAVACGPWYYFTREMVQAGWAGPGYHRPERSLLVSLSMIPVGMLPFIAIGYWTRFVRPLFRGTLSIGWALWGAFIPAWWLFHAVVPSGTIRRMLVATLAIGIVFGGIGIGWLIRRSFWGGIPMGARALGLVALCGAMLYAEGIWTRPKDHPGFVEVAQDLVNNPSLKQSGILVSSLDRGEGMLVAEVARMRPHPEHFIIRGSKLLSSSKWSNRGYEPRFKTIGGVATCLDEVPVSVLVLHNNHRGWPLAHHEQLWDLVRTRPDLWRHAATYPRASHAPPGSSIEVYRRVGPARPVTGKLEFGVSVLGTVSSE